jgi:hypothetical protein
MMKLRQCGKTCESQENCHFSLNNGANSSWIRNSAISYENGFLCESQENGHFSLNNGANSSWIRNSAISYEHFFFYLYTNTRKCCLLLFK